MATVRQSTALAPARGKNRQIRARFSLSSHAPGLGIRQMSYASVEQKRVLVQHCHQGPHARTMSPLCARMAFGGVRMCKASALMSKLRRRAAGRALHFRHGVLLMVSKRPS
eukprot:COSAG02_NODE_40440_length_405_cov_1.349673_1_plen_110_part_01